MTTSIRPTFKPSKMEFVMEKKTNPKPLTIRIDEAQKRKFFSMLAANGETAQSVMEKAVMEYIAKNNK